MNPEHQSGSAEQALAFLAEQIGPEWTAVALAPLFRDVYNFHINGFSNTRAMRVTPLKNGKRLYLTGEIK